MRIISRKAIFDYSDRHPSVRANASHWISVVQQADWRSMDQIRQAFSTAKILNGERVRFEIAAGYRLIAAFNFPARIAFIKFIGSHVEYDKVDALTVSKF